MAASPPFKVYDMNNVYRASFFDPSDAAIFIAALGHGSTIRHGHSRRDIMWLEGCQEKQAMENYDFVATTVYANMKERGRHV